MNSTGDTERLREFKRRYGGRYRVRFVYGEGGELIDAEILTRFARRDERKGEAQYAVWEHADGELAALVPTISGKRILENFPFVKIYLETDEGVILMFAASRLDELAGVLRLRRRKRLSSEQREKLVQAGLNTRLKGIHAGCSGEVAPRF